MNLLLWILLGLIAGWLASVIMKTNAEQGPILDIVLGIVGAIVGGLVMNLLGFGGVTGFNIGSILVATLGAIVLIAIGRAIK
ncbi:MAG: GlsB/YeaQ/YmgE family stress response membrane protein [Patescibacteria group bacterium]|jgi:uncharacterized membrane protein YeaQ/YmgE (transglycosylase-associated protein family)